MGSYTPYSVMQFPSIAALVATPSPPRTPFTAGELLGFANPGDYGEGQVYWNPMSVAPPDNFLTFQPVDKPAQGRWLRNPRDGIMHLGWSGCFASGLTPLQSTLAMQNFFGTVAGFPSARVNGPASASLVWDRNTSQDAGTTAAVTGMLTAGQYDVPISSFTNVAAGMRVTPTTSSHLAYPTFVRRLNPSAGTITLSAKALVTSTETLTIGGAAMPWGVFLPGNMLLKLNYSDMMQDYRGTQAPGGDGTCGWASFSNQGATTYWKAGLEIEMGLVQPTAVGTNSDWLWANPSNSQLMVRNGTHGQPGAISNTIPLVPSALTGHRHLIVTPKFESTQGFTGQRFFFSGIDYSACSDVGILIIQCDQPVFGPGMRGRACGSHAVEVGCNSNYTFNGIPAIGTVNNAVLWGNYEINVGSGYKATRANGSKIFADFEANAVGRAGVGAPGLLDANIDFTGTTFYDSTATGNTHSNGTIDGLSVNPLTQGWANGMYVSGFGIPATTIFTNVTSTSVTLNKNARSSLTGIKLVVRGTPGAAGTYGNTGAFGDLAGRTYGVTFGNSQTGAYAINVITQDGTILNDDIHQSLAVQQYGILHLGVDQPLDARTEVFQGSVQTKFHPDCASGGIMTVQGTECRLLPSVGQLIAHGSALANGIQLTEQFTLDNQAILVLACGLTGTGGPSANLKIQLFRSDGTVISTLSSNTAWTIGSYVTNLPINVGGYPFQQVLNITQLTDAAWQAGNKYVLVAINAAGSDDTCVGGVEIMRNLIIPA